MMNYVVSVLGTWVDVFVPTLGWVVGGALCGVLSLQALVWVTVGTLIGAGILEFQILQLEEDKADGNG